MSENENKQPEDKSKVRKSQTLREAVRMRPGMYLGGTDDRALLASIFYVLGYGLKVASQNLCDHLEITLRPNNTIVVEDNGPGLLVDIDPDENKSIAEILLTTGYRESDDFPWPVPVAFVNHASTEGKAQVRRDGYAWEQAYQTGIPAGPLAQIRALEPNESTGNTFTFTLDPVVFDRGDEISYADLAVRVRELAYCLPGLRISLCDERQHPIVKHEYHYPAGITNFIEHLNRECVVLHDVIHRTDEFELRLQDREPYTVKVDFALQFTDCAESFELSYFSIPGYQSLTETTWGGPHVDALRRGVCAAIRKVAEKQKLTATSDAAELLRGMTAVLHVAHPLPEYDSATRRSIANSDLRVVDTSVFLAVEAFFKQDGDVLQRVLTRTSGRVLPEKERRYGEFASDVKYDWVWW